VKGIFLSQGGKNMEVSIPRIVNFYPLGRKRIEVFPFIFGKKVMENFPSLAGKVYCFKNFNVVLALP